MTTTTNFCDFNLNDLIELLTAWKRHGLPEDFYDTEVHPMMNTISGNLFLTNADYQVCMLNGDKLESWYYCHNCGHEGFHEDCQLNDDGCNECTPEEDEEAEDE